MEQILVPTKTYTFQAQSYFLMARRLPVLVVLPDRAEHGSLLSQAQHLLRPLLRREFLLMEVLQSIIILE